LKLTFRLFQSFVLKIAEIELQYLTKMPVAHEITPRINSGGRPIAVPVSVPPQA
jgi:hypothetical protein